MYKIKQKNIFHNLLISSIALSLFAQTGATPAFAKKSKEDKSAKQEVIDSKKSKKKEKKTKDENLVTQKKGSGPSEAAKARVLEESERPIKDKWAIVIGINEFEDKSIPTLRYAAKDAQDFAKFLVERGNFAKDHVLLLLNKEATKHNIISNLADTWLPRRVLPDDLVVIYASTHGSPKELDVGGDNFLIAHDTKKDELYTTGISFPDLAPSIKRRTECDRIVLILDACNSGAAKVGGKGLFRSSNFDVNALAGKGQIVISSSDANQRSWESKRYQNGVFTRNLIQILEKSKETGDSSLETAFDKLKDTVQSEVRFDRQAHQTPVMHSKWKGDPLRLTAKPIAPRSVDTPSTKSKFTYDKVLYRLKHPPKPKVVKVEKPKPVVTQPVVNKPVVQQPQIIEAKPQQNTSKPIVVPPGKTYDAWYKFTNRK